MATKVKARAIKKTPGNGPKKTKRKFKIPTALTILIGVAFFAIVLSWIIGPLINHHKDSFTMKGWYSEQYSGWLSGFTKAGREEVIKLTNAFLDNTDPKLQAAIAQFHNHDLSGMIKYFQGHISPFSDHKDLTQFKTLAPALWIDGNWFNFPGYENWYISNDGIYGIGDIVTAFIAGGFSAWDLIFFIIAIGIVIELLMEAEVLKSLVNSLIKGFNNRRLLLLPILFVLFSVWGTILASQEATLALMPIIVPALIIAGFDATTGFLVILVGCTTGIGASVLEPFALGTLSKAFDEVYTAAGGTQHIAIGTGILLRMVLWILYTTVGCLFVTWYGRKALLKKKTIETKEMIEDNKKWALTSFGETDHKPMNKKQKIALGIVGFLMFWMIFVLLPWSSWTSATSSSIWKTISHFFFFSSSIGSWKFIQLALLFVAGWFIAAKVFKFTNRQMLNNVKNAWKTFRVVAIILVFSRAASIVLTYSGTAHYLASNVFVSFDGMPGGSLSLVIFPLYAAMAMFIPSMTGLAGISAPIISPIIAGYKHPSQMLPAIIGIMALYPLAQGLINMTSPTTGLVVAQAEVSRTNFAKVFPLLISYAGVLAAIGLSVVSIDLFLLQ